MTTNFVYIIYIRARRNQHQWVYSLWPGWCRQPAPSSFTLLCNLHHHPLHYYAACTIISYMTAACTIISYPTLQSAPSIISYPTLQPAPSSVTLLCSLQQNPYPVTEPSLLHLVWTACANFSSWSQYCWLMTERPGVKHSERWPMSQWLCMCKRKRYTLTGNNNGVL